MKKYDNEKILLLLLPFWDPQVPPMGLACLKSYLSKHGYQAKTVDANIEEDLREVYQHYFDTLKSALPEQKQGNFYKVGHDVLRSHMLAHLHYTDEAAYRDLVKKLVYQVFYVHIDSGPVLKLQDILAKFYQRLEKYMLGLLKKEQPRILGISVYGDTLPASLAAFKIAKKIDPGIKTLLGGGIFSSDLAPGTPNLEFFLEKTPYIDHILVGEGETLFLAFLKGELPPSRRLYLPADNPRGAVDISLLDIPDYSDFDLLYYPYLGAYTSRSCPFQCRFCTETALWGKFRSKSGDQAAAELAKLSTLSGSQMFLMSDSLLNPTIGALSEGLLKEEKSIYWDGYFRADRHAADRKNTLLWRRAGFYRARLGIESGSPRVLKLMQKRVTVEQIKAALSGLAYAGIKTTTYWVVGYPGEREADFQQTLDLLTMMADDIYEADCTPFWYYFSTTVDAGVGQSKAIPIFDGSERDMVLLQTWILDCEPGQETIIDRMWRFVRHCQDLGIPNPYSMREFYQADLRWQKLHKNAVPVLVEFDRGRAYIDENKQVSDLDKAAARIDDDGDFVF